MLGDKKSRKPFVLKLALALFCGVGLIAGYAGSAVSAAADDFSIIASVQNQTLVNGATSRVPVAGVAVTVTKKDGSIVGSGITDEKGLCTVAVPSRDDYSILIDQSTLPDGLVLIDAEKASVTISKDLFTTNTKRVTFFTGDGSAAGATETERILQ